jgi:transposase
MQIIWKELPDKKGNLFFCFEDTGKYSLPLCIFLNGEKLSFSMVPTLDIKRSLGLVRGKNDQKDASFIFQALSFQIAGKLIRITNLEIRCIPRMEYIACWALPILSCIFY